MKNLLVITLLFIGGTSFAQSSYGIKGGLNYGATGDYKNFSEGVEDATTTKGKNTTGYHLGGFAKFEVLGFFLQPELVYTRLNTDYDTFEYKIDKIDAPILVGLNFLGPLNLKAGPSFQYIINNKIDNSTLKVSDVKDKITLGYQLGAGLSLGRLGFDVGYEGAFKENTAGSETASENFTIDSRPSQWIFSLAYSFN